MLINIDDDLPQVFQTVKQEIRRAIKDRKHPFRFMVLGTASNSPEMRYVVLRTVDENFNLNLYTDYRSDKVGQIKENATVTLLFYHPQKRAQVIITGHAGIHHEDACTKQHWNKVKDDARKAYCSILPPGQPIATPNAAYAWEEHFSPENFAVISVVLERIEVLQLRGVEHLRASFSKADNWIGTWLVP